VKVRGRGGDEYEGLHLNLSTRYISSSSQNACLAAGLRADLLRELRRLPDFTFNHKFTKHVWRPGSARTRWGSLSALQTAYSGHRCAKNV
jgi:hypothetical protein